MILGDLIINKGGMINLKTRLVIIRIKGKIIIVNFNILPLKNDEVVLGMP